MLACRVTLGIALLAAAGALGCRGEPVPVAASPVAVDAVPPEVEPAALAEAPVFAPDSALQEAERLAVRQLAVVLRSAAWERHVYGRASADTGWARDEYLDACRAVVPDDRCRTRLALVERRPVAFETWDGGWEPLERTEAERVERLEQARAAKAAKALKAKLAKAKAKKAAARARRHSPPTRRGVSVESASTNRR